MGTFFDWISGWLNSFWSLLYDGLVWLLMKYLIFQYEKMLWLVNLGKDILLGFVTSSGIMTNFTSAWGSLPVNARAVLEILRLPEAVLLILGAYVIRFTLRMFYGAK